MADPLKILIADDDAGVRDLVCIRLRIAGYDPHMAKNGREAVERAVKLRPAAMILDINMPELDGFGVLSEMQDKAPEIQVPTLVLTARQSSDDVRMAVALGARGYLTKPFTEAQLLARVTGLFRGRTLSREIDEEDVVEI
ncbi:MAG: response regulator [Alphaproteobacteria bacterium]|nr:MAG: response regulator [Alphaproteobacteria bacterium]PZO35203.1 MAG: response regulator [Alphaproteobacteria bacterium]